MQSEITFNTIENRSPSHKRHAENVIKYISCGRLLLKSAEKGLKIRNVVRLHLFLWWRVVKVKNRYPRYRSPLHDDNILNQCDSKQFLCASRFAVALRHSFMFLVWPMVWKWEPVNRNIFIIPQPPSPLPIAFHYGQEWVSFRHVFLNRAGAVDSSAILDKTRFFAPRNQLDNKTKDHWSELRANSRIYGNHPRPSLNDRELWRLSRMWSRTRKAREYCCRSALRGRLFFVFPSS